MSESLAYPKDERDNYSLIKTCVGRVFASRGKSPTKVIEETWISELLDLNMSADALKKATTEFVRNEEYNLLLPVFIKLIQNCSEKKIIVKKDCPYCEGRNYVYNTIFFEKNGNYVAQDYAVKCYHNDNSDNTAKMVVNENEHNKTEIKGGYLLVFKNIPEKENYLKKVELNRWKDLWVVTKGELVPFYVPKEEELVSENLVIPDPEEEFPDDEDIPF